MINWQNINLDSDYERDLNILDSYNFETLLLEIHSNIREINEDEIREHFEIVLNNKIQTAREIFNANIINITQQAKKEREN